MANSGCFIVSPTCQALFLRDANCPGINIRPGSSQERKRRARRFLPEIRSGK